MVSLRPRKHQDDDAAKDVSGDDVQDNGSGKKPYVLQRPANTALQQQRLKAWHPILTHAAVIPMLFGAGILFAILGAVMYWSALQINEFTIQYSSCSEEAPTDTPANIPSKYYEYRFKDVSAPSQVPQWRKREIPVKPGNQRRFNCWLYFTVPAQMDSSVFFYYKLTNFYQNHRRYLKSVDYEQLLNKKRTPKQLQDMTCKPLGWDHDNHDLAVYPCGLIANSVFNDTFGHLQPIDNMNRDHGMPYIMSEKNIVWSKEWQHYRSPTYDPKTIIPPPYWRGSEGGPFSYPNGYNASNVFDPTKNEHFQVWMQTAAFPTFRKLYQRNDSTPLIPGRYALLIDDNYPVTMFGGTKSIVLSEANWIGGRNLFTGLIQIAIAALSFAIGIALLTKQLITPRRVGDPRYLSWNMPRRQR